MDLSPRRRRSRRPLKDATNENNESVPVHSQKLRTSDISERSKKVQFYISLGTFTY